jgi:hypothetical protein
MVAERERVGARNQTKNKAWDLRDGVKAGVDSRKPRRSRLRTKLFEIQLR